MLRDYRHHEVREDTHPLTSMSFAVLVVVWKLFLKVSVLHLTMKQPRVHLP